MIIGKLAPPPAPDGFVTRKRLVDRFDPRARVVTVVAPPGYGKTEAARQWASTTHRPTAWLNVDLLDARPTDFWVDLVASLRIVLPDLGTGLDHGLRTRDSADPWFVGELIAELERIATPAAMVLDGLELDTDRSVLAHLSLMVERIGHQLQLVCVGRSDLAIPTARWRSAGILAEVRQADLRMTDEEAIAVASTFPSLTLTAESVKALNARAEGWPAGLQLSLLALLDAEDPDAAAQTVAGSDRLLADYLVAEVLDSLPDAERQVALGLSVLEVFDSEACAYLLGPSAVPLARELGRRRLFLTVIDHHTGAMRFHPMFRELLEHELRWRDPGERIELHRRAARMWQEQGDEVAAVRQLALIGERSATGPSSQPDAAPCSPVDPAGVLTPREASLLALLPTYLSYAQIGERLFLSVNTVKGNLKALYRKLDVASRAEAVTVATARGLIGPGAPSDRGAPTRTPV